MAPGGRSVSACKNSKMGAWGAWFVDSLKTLETTKGGGSKAKEVKGSWCVQRKNAVGACILVMEPIGCYKCRCVLCSSLRLLSSQYRNFIVPIPDVVVFLVFLPSLYFCFSLLFADLVAGLVLFKLVSSCSCF